MTWETDAGHVGPYKWRLNNLLLDSPGLTEKVQLEIGNNFQWNKGFASEIIIWDAFKAYIRGILLVQKAFRERGRNPAQTKLQAMIQQLETEHKMNLSPTILDALIAKKEELMINQDTENCLRYHVC